WTRPASGWTPSATRRSGWRKSEGSLLARRFFGGAELFRHDGAADRRAERAVRLSAAADGDLAVAGLVVAIALAGHVLAAEAGDESEKRCRENDATHDRAHPWGCG